MARLPQLPKLLALLAMLAASAHAAEQEPAATTLPEPGEDPANPIVIVEPAGKIQMSEGIPALPIDDIGVPAQQGAHDFGLDAWQGTSFDALRNLAVGMRGVNDPLVREWLKTLWAAKATPPEHVSPQGAWLKLRMAKLLASGRTPMARQLLNEIPESVRDAGLDGTIADILLMEAPIKEVCTTAASMLAARPSPSFQRLSLLCQAYEKNTSALELNLTLLEEQNQFSEPLLKDELRRIASGKPGGVAKLPQPPSLLLAATAGLAGAEIHEPFFATANTAVLRFLAREDAVHAATRAMAMETLVARGMGQAKDLADAYKRILTQHDTKESKAVLARAKAAQTLESEKDALAAVALFRKGGLENALAGLLTEVEPFKLGDGPLVARIVRHAALHDDLDGARAWLEANHFTIEETRVAALEMALHISEKGSVDEASLEPFLTLDTTALKDAKAARIATALRIAEALGVVLPESLGALKAGTGPTPPDDGTRLQALLAAAKAGHKGETVLRIAYFNKGGYWLGAPEALAGVVSAAHELGGQEDAADLARNILLDVAL